MDGISGISCFSWSALSFFPSSSSEEIQNETPMDAKGILKEFNKNKRIQDIKIGQVSSLTQETMAVTSINTDFMIIINKALFFLGYLTTAETSVPNWSWKVYSNDTVVALSQFERDNSITPGTIAGTPAPGKVIGKTILNTLERELKKPANS
ncbi:hypothetical protein A3J90_04210 [candidate division WOR-1 bacterium RIFOXYC2_FULL_37_10]|uniref:Uncharacterized protein n=1 Tax=candidate division WOR-1 bacterium RIFOXYB2_FULL_37_13 TaxID=1802579 RepID=A0A1F4SRA2_UNCSA|nr:MAG: hypothetical protein A2246_02630 [candidate division WOR-1 bacterium RIFOXYA2_FULL_37_7]OGC22968.1 MAG: hypothetical protein A2310_04085 [candidate division WOR-1 bacterium RIFOXYB2_FULL_37_13]OGC34325.1 MAG: hypothetical protein A3J90_04210 [candidate division WOR-1 bacterium RIFOXYC2_FULL_37_10]